MCCFLIIAPPAFLMGFPMPTAMTTLGRLGKEHMFIWAWGVNAPQHDLRRPLPILIGAVCADIGAFDQIVLPMIRAVRGPYRQSRTGVSVLAIFSMSLTFVRCRRATRIAEPTREPRHKHRHS